MAKRSAEDTRSVLDAADEQETDDSAVNRLVHRLLRFGLDGVGPLTSAQQLAERTRRRSSSTEDAVRKVNRQALAGGGIGGVLTGIGGFVTMPVAIPINVLEFYIQATRMVGAIATLRGYNVADDRIRTAVLLTLVGSRASDVLKSAGIKTPGGPLAGLALRRLPPAALMLVNKAIGVRLLRGVGEKLLSRLGRGLPIAGGAIGGALDLWMMKRIADHAAREFPAQLD